MFTEEGRFRGDVMSAIKDQLPNLSLDELDEVDEFIDKLIEKRNN